MANQLWQKAAHFSKVHAQPLASGHRTPKTQPFPSCPRAGSNMGAECAAAFPCEARSLGAVSASLPSRLLVGGRPFPLLPAHPLMSPRLTSRVTITKEVGAAPLASSPAPSPSSPTGGGCEAVSEPSGCSSWPRRPGRPPRLLWGNRARWAGVRRRGVEAAQECELCWVAGERSAAPGAACSPAASSRPTSSGTLSVGSGLADTQLGTGVTWGDRGWERRALRASQVGRSC